MNTFKETPKYSHKIRKQLHKIQRENLDDMTGYNELITEIRTAGFTPDKYYS